MVNASPDPTTENIGTNIDRGDNDHGRGRGIVPVNSRRIQYRSPTMPRPYSVS